MRARHAAPCTLQPLTLQHSPPRHRSTGSRGTCKELSSTPPHRAQCPQLLGMCPLRSPFQQLGAGYPSTNSANSFWSQCCHGLTSAGPKDQAERGCSWQASEWAAELTCRQPRAKSELFAIHCTHNFKSRSRLQPLSNKLKLILIIETFNSNKPTYPLPSIPIILQYFPIRQSLTSAAATYGNLTTCRYSPPLESLGSYCKKQVISKN